MPSARAWALDCLLRGEKKGRFPDRLIRNLEGRHPEISALDRAFIRQLVYGVYRWRARIDWVLERYSRRSSRKYTPRLLSILRLGIFQILFLDRVPVSAAVNESVQLAKAGPFPWTAGLVNGILRSLVREKETLHFPGIEEPRLYLTVTQSHPEWLVEAWLPQLGFGETAALCEANNRIPPLTLRVNTLKTTREELVQRLRETFQQVEPTVYSPVGICIFQPRTPLEETAMFHDGLFHIQDEASQLATFLLDPRPGEKILDLCGGVGGKATHLGQAMGNRGAILTVDRVSWKTRECIQNAGRLGVSIIQGLTADVLKDELPSGTPATFDRILLDAPCSGWGVIRRHPDLKWRVGPEDGPRLAAQQLKFLQKAAGWLKPKGVLVYATCTLNPQENEAVVERFLSGHTAFRSEAAAAYLPEAAADLCDPRGYYKAWPHRHGTDGFFAARLVRG